MPTGVEYVRAICKERGIKVSTLERDLKFGNGYLNPKKLKKISYERAVAMAEYLGCDVEPILKGDNSKVITLPHVNLSKLSKEYLSEEEKKVLALHMGLNKANKEKVIKYAEALLYAQEEEASHLHPLAAHESTGIETAPENETYDKALIKDMAKQNNDN